MHGPLVIVARSPVKQRDYFWTGDGWSESASIARQYFDRRHAQIELADAPRLGHAWPPRIEAMPAAAAREAKNVR